jgi:tight adherence protein C
MLRSDDFLLISTAIAALAGIAVALVAWLLSRKLSSIPAQDRTHRDPMPPLFRLMRWPVHWTGYFIGPLVKAAMQTELQARLRSAGQEFTLTPTEYIASRAVYAALGFGLAWLMLGMFESPRVAAGQDGFSGALFWSAVVGAAGLGWFIPAIWLRDRIVLRRRDLLRSLPFFLDSITLCVEAGLNLFGALTQTVAKAPKGPLRDEFQRVLRDVRAGKPRAVALREMAERTNEVSVKNFTSAVIQAETLGMALGPVLRAQADQRRAERFLRAEKLGMQAPVKLLVPLIGFIFPCTFIVLAFPLVVKFMQMGL